MEKCIAFIWHGEDYTNKEECICYVRPLTGRFRDKILSGVLTTGIFRYYYWGVTLEEIELDQNGNFGEVRDLTIETLKYYNMSVMYALTFNEETSDVLGSDGFVYRLNQSIFYNKCKPVYDYIMQEIKTAQNFSLRLYTKDGGILSFLFDKNVSPKAAGYKYVLNRGFITSDKSILRTMIPATSSESSSKDKLTQADVDKMIEEMLSKD